MPAALVTMGLPFALVAYGAFSAAVAHRWIGAVTAPLVAALLWARWPRARFSAYVFFSALGLRGLVTHQWAAVAFAAVAIVVMQTPAARRAWPRLSRRRQPAPTALE